MIRIKSFSLIGHYSFGSIILYDDILHHCEEFHLNALFLKVLLYTGIYLIPLLGPKVPYGTFHQLQICLDGSLSYLRYLIVLIQPVYIFICPEFKVNVIGLMYELSCLVIT